MKSSRSELKSDSACEVFQSQFSKSHTKIYRDLEREMRKIHNQIVAKTKRNPYVRSKYFKNQKIFVGLFWNHLAQKNERDRKRRLKFYRCAIDLLRNSVSAPEMKLNPNKSSEILYRFYGRTRDNKLFCVQVKQEPRSPNKYFMSVFPVKIST